MTEDQFKKELGNRIRYLRRCADLKQGELSRRLGWSSNSHLCQIERGQKMPSAFAIHQIEKHIGPVWVEADGT